MQRLKTGLTPLSVDLPQFHRPIKAATGQEVPIGTEGERTDPNSMSEEGFEAAPTGITPISDFPQLDTLIIPATGKDLPIGMKGQRPDSANMPLEGAETASIALFPNFPNPHHPIIVSLHQEVPLRAESESADDAAISLESSQAPSALYIPKLHFPTIGDAGEYPTRAESNCTKPDRMARERSQTLGIAFSSHLPHLHGTIIAATRQQVTLRVEGE